MKKWPLIISLFPIVVSANQNTQIDSFSKAKRLLMQQVYNSEARRKTVYCDAIFDAKKRVTQPAGFDNTLYTSRSKRVEFEHIVPAENFGRAFVEWREGDKQCVNSKGKPYKGRKCANKSNHEYRLMQADGYNLFAAIGSVNAYRSNYNFQMMSGTESDFGSCDFHVENRKAQPPEQARGVIARTYLYFDMTYSQFRLSQPQRKLFTAWDKQYPVSEFECKKAQIVEAYQHNKNPVLADRCTRIGG